jgi:hypothetical protein
MSMHPLMTLGIAFAVLATPAYSGSLITGDPPMLVAATQGGPGPTDVETEYECEGEPQLALYVIDHPGCGDFGGEHVLGPNGYVRFGFRSTGAGAVGPIPFTGKLSARIIAQGAGSELPCSWVHGEFIGCDPGIFPPLPPGVPFRFECGSLQGSYGHWGECFLAYT